jgi:uncharacterized membrane protein YfcA
MVVIKHKIHFFVKRKTMEILFISAVAFLAAILTFFSGFGLGTLLTPVFALFFPVETAIALTGVVHFGNNLFKLGLVAKHANKAVLIKFGIPAVIASLAGAWILLQIADSLPWFSYSIGEHTFQVLPLKFIIAILLIIFALFDLIPALGKIQFGPEKLVLGGILSGFFGGLSGHQGALRSAFLSKAGLSKEAFIGTAVVVSTFIDLSRLGIYSTRYSKLLEGDHLVSSSHIALVLLVTIIAAISGAIIGNQLLKKVTVDFLQYFVAVALMVIAVALGAGLI